MAATNAMSAGFGVAVFGDVSGDAFFAASSPAFADATRFGTVQLVCQPASACLGPHGTRHRQASDSPRYGKVGRGLAALDTRERDVLVATIEGQSVQATAESLDVSTRTVDRLRKSIFRKLGVEGPVQLARAIGYIEALESASELWGDV